MEDYSIQKLHHKPGRMALLIAALLAAGVLVFVSWYVTQVYQQSSQDSYPTQFSIATGTTAHQIAASLHDKKLINSPTAFLIYTHVSGAAGKIEAGNYTLDRNMTIAEIVSVITQGRVTRSDRSFTMIEGWNNDQIAKYLTQQKLITAPADLQKTLMSSDWNFQFNDIATQFSYQGFLYPDTYRIDKTGTASDLVEKMLANFESKITPQMLTDIAAQKKTLGQVLILSSIIEKEVGRNKAELTPSDITTMQQERRMVASVFYNRLAIGMPLESDATVNYITGKSTPSVSIADTKIKSPYNTYQVKGLPPTPIANPGIDSIMAAIYPAQSNNLYFLNSPDGTAYFAQTLAQHNANKAKYLH